MSNINLWDSSTKVPAGIYHVKATVSATITVDEDDELYGVDLLDEARDRGETIDWEVNGE